MAKHRRPTRRFASKDRPVSWLPVDSRLIHPLVSFGRVRGVAKIFLEIEMILALCVVVGTMVLVFLSFL